MIEKDLKAYFLIHKKFAVFEKFTIAATILVILFRPNRGTLQKPMANTANFVLIRKYIFKFFSINIAWLFALFV